MILIRLETDGFWWEQFKIIQNYKRNDNSNKMENIEQRWVIPQTTFRAKELETKSTTRKQENLKNDYGIVRFRMNIDLERRRETHGWMQ